MQGAKCLDRRIARTGVAQPLEVGLKIDAVLHAKLLPRPGLVIGYPPRRRKHPGV